MTKILFVCHGNIKSGKLTNSLKRIYGIPSEAADRFGKNQIYLPSFCIINHAIKSITLFSVSACYAFVSINADEFPFWITTDIFSVIIHLGFVTRLLLILFSRNTSIGCNFQLWRFRLLRIQSFDVYRLQNSYSFFIIHSRYSFLRFYFVLVASSLPSSFLFENQAATRF